MRLYNTVYAILVLCCCMWHNEIYANDEAVFGEANALMSAGKYEDAIKLYNGLCDAGNNSAALHVNIGDAYFRLNKWAAAAWHYEKAALLSPSDKDIRHNIRVLNSRLKDHYPLYESPLPVRMWEQTAGAMSANMWAILSVVLGLGVSGSIAWGWLKGVKRMWIVAAMLGSGWLLSIMAGIHQKAVINMSSSFGIIFEAECALKQAPDAQSADGTLIHEGLKVKVLDKISGYYKVELPNGEEGWLAESSLQLI